MPVVAASDIPCTVTGKSYCASSTYFSVTSHARATPVVTTLSHGLPRFPYRPPQRWMQGPYHSQASVSEITHTDAASGGGRIQRMPRRSIASPTLLREASMPWTSWRLTRSSTATSATGRPTASHSRARARSTPLPSAFESGGSPARRAADR